MWSAQHIEHVTPDVPVGGAFVPVDMEGPMCNFLLSNPCRLFGMHEYLIIGLRNVVPFMVYYGLTQRDVSCGKRHKPCHGTYNLLMIHLALHQCSCTGDPTICDGVGVEVAFSILPYRL
eukprot:GHRR01029846.1.p1 GENE.GHRR01029846.1~~GHRR01029846.1.p1  ORF type:complete len:119 (-),score=14.05 GHRR01029846.1:92-448(-)